MTSPAKDRVEELADGLSEALATFDERYAKCPFSSSSRRPPDPNKPCPACRATASDGCGKWGGAANDFINAARNLLLSRQQDQSK